MLKVNNTMFQIEQIPQTYPPPSTIEIVLSIFFGTLSICLAIMISIVLGAWIMRKLGF